MKQLFILLFATFAVIAGCSQDSPLEPSTDQIVVRGYIYAGEPINDIQITSTLPLGSEETQAPPVNDAGVSLVRNGTGYALVPSAGDSGYYHYEGDDLKVEPGDAFEIRVEHNGSVTTGKTQVPAPPEDVTASSDKLIISTPGFGFGNQQDSTRFIIIHWKEDASSLFYVVVENMEENPEPISRFGGPGGNDKIRRRFVFPPTNNNEFRIQRFNVSYYGEHIAKVYRVNQEYADLYQSRNQDSRDLNEPLTNIENGLGIFSAFASTSFKFTVVAE
ncbi:MAG: DUF4249 family protein [Calditrichaeota bacterium]|nr:DUF4249 family protein [Calditrichota bacterium]